VHTLERRQRIAAPPDTVFAFFSDPANLARLTPAWLSFRIHGDPPASLGKGSRIEYRIRWSLVTIRWVTRITRWRPTVEFEDVQERGPYAAWTHRHRFRLDAAGVVMEDRVDYALPFGPLGRLVHRLRVRGQLERIFDYRREQIARIFPGGGASR
jgi:ligand-binding SRPBCC domain-containing protein